MIRPLGIIFVHFVSRYFNVKIKLPKEMPKNRMPKMHFRHFSSQGIWGETPRPLN